MLWSGRRLRIRQRRYGCISSTRNRTRRSRKNTKLKRRRTRRSRKPRKNPKPKRNLRRPRRNERESFNQSRGQGSEDRHHRRWAWFAGRARCRGRNARGATLRFSEYENKSRRRYVRRETVAAKRNWARSRRLRCIADLARWWRRV